MRCQSPIFFSIAGFTCVCKHEWHINAGGMCSVPVFQCVLVSVCSPMWYLSEYRSTSAHRKHTGAFTIKHFTVVYSILVYHGESSVCMNLCGGWLAGWNMAEFSWLLLTPVWAPTDSPSPLHLSGGAASAPVATEQTAVSKTHICACYCVCGICLGILQETEAWVVGQTTVHFPLCWCRPSPWRTLSSFGPALEPPLLL